jgi:hypothetical protein
MNMRIRNTCTIRVHTLTPALLIGLASLILIVVPSMTWAQAEAPWLILDGEDPGYVEVPHDPALNPESITVEAWVYMVTGHNFEGYGCPPIVGKGFQDSWWLGICDNRIMFYSHGQGSARQSRQLVPNGEWVHIAATWDGSHMRFFINGLFDSENALDLGPMPVANTPLRIGSDVSFDYRPHAAIDEVRIWSTARSEAEIAATMNSSINSAMTGLVAVWNLDGDSTSAVGGFNGSNVGNTVYGSTLPEPNPCKLEYFLPVAAHAEGTLGTKWFTNLSMLNIGGSTARVFLHLLKPNVDNSNTVGVEFSIDLSESLEVRDVVFEEFGEDNMSGALRICTDQPLVIDSRTFNAPSKAVATYGQGVPGEPSTSATPGTWRMIGLYENDQFRTNIGILNTTSQATTVYVRMLTEDNEWLGDKEFELPPYGYKQRSQIFTKVTNDDIENGTIKIWTTDGTGILVYASVVDNSSGDGTYNFGD